MRNILHKTGRKGTRPGRRAGERRPHGLARPGFWYNSAHDGRNSVLFRRVRIGPRTGWNALQMTYKPFSNEETRTSVLAGVRSGTEEAWGRFFDLYAGYVYQIALHAGILASDADDIVQTVFAGLSAPGGFDGYERGKGSFRSWLRRRVGWRVADALRRRSSGLAVDDSLSGDLDSVPAAPGAGTSDEAWIEAARAEALRRLRAASSPEHFAVFQASVLEEIPTEDVMRLYRVSRDNLYQIRKRMKAAYAELLRAALDDLDAPLPPGK